MNYRNESIATALAMGFAPMMSASDVDRDIERASRQRRRVANAKRAARRGNR